MMMVKVEVDFINDRDISQNISDKRKKRFRKKIHYKKSITVLLAVVLTLIQLVGCVNEGANEESTLLVEVDENCAIGTILEAGTMQVQVTDMKKWEGNDNYQPTRRYEYVVLTIVIKNNSESIGSYNSLNYKIQNNSGELFETIYTDYNRDSELVCGRLLPGGIITGTLVFEVPKDEEPLLFIYNDSALYDKNYGINLTNQSEAFQVLQEDLKPLTELEYGINESVDFGGARITIVDIEMSNGYKIDIPKEGYEFIYLTVQIENINDEKEYYNSSQFLMSNSYGQLCESKFDTITNTDIGSGYLESGESITGTVLHEQPIDASNLKVIYEETYFEEERIVFDID